MEPKAISLFLYENMLTFFNDIEDIAACQSMYSCLDGHKSKYLQSYQYAYHQYTLEIEQLHSVIESMAITEMNLHKELPKTKIQFQAPQFYEYMRNVR